MSFSDESDLIKSGVLTNPVEPCPKTKMKQVLGVFGST